MPITMNYDLGNKLIKLLGLPEKTTAFRINFATGAAVTIECEYLVELSEEGEQELIGQFAEWRLEQKPEEEF